MSTSEEKKSFWHCVMITNGQELSVEQGKKAFYVYHIQEDTTKSAK